MNEIGIDTSYLLTGVESQDLKDKANVYSSTLAEDELIKTRIQLMLNQADFRSALREMNDEQVKAMVQLVKSLLRATNNGKKTATDDLSENHKLELNQKLINSNFRDYVELELWLKSLGYDIGKSSIHRYGQKKKKNLKNASNDCYATWMNSSINLSCCIGV